MIEIPRPQDNENIEENIIKDLKNLFRLNKLQREANNDAVINGVRNIFRLKKEMKALKDTLIRHFLILKKKIIITQ